MGRHQNISLIQESSLQNQQRMQIQGGVKLTLYKPQQKANHGADTELKSCSKSSDDDQMALTKDGYPMQAWEKKQMKRLRDERSGKLEPMKVSEVKDGGPVKLKNKISRGQYQQEYNHFGMIGRIKGLMEADEIEYDENIFKEPNMIEKDHI